jgi:hypothetical protein
VSKRIISEAVADTGDERRKRDGYLARRLGGAVLAAGLAITPAACSDTPHLSSADKALIQEVSHTGTTHVLPKHKACPSGSGDVSSGGDSITDGAAAVTIKANIWYSGDPAVYCGPEVEPDTGLNALVAQTDASDYHYS